MSLLLASLSYLSYTQRSSGTALVAMRIGTKDSSRTTQPWLAPLVVLVATLALSASFLQVATAPSIPGGWDGVPQFAIAHLYATKLFPAISGWLPEYFAGMPFPDFYPPVFYLLVGSLTRVGCSSASAYYVVVGASVMALPLIVALVSQRMARSGLAAMVSGAVAIAFVISGRSSASLGGTLYASFNLGLASHALGLDALLGAVYFLVAVPRSGRARAGAAVCLALVPLCNVHVAWDAVLLGVSVVGVRLWFAESRAARLQVLRAHAVVLVLAVLLPLCWLLPMIAHLAYVPTKALEPVEPIAVLRAYLHHFAYLAVAAWLALRSRAPMPLAIVAVVSLVLGFAVLPLHRMLAGFSIQPWRVLAAFEPLAAIAIGAIVGSLANLLRAPLLRVLIGIIVAFGFLSRAAPWCQPEGLLDEATVADYDRLLAALPLVPAGRVLVEMGMGRGGGFAVQALVGSSGASAATTVFREASVSSLFTVPLRNSLSSNQEQFGIDTKIDPEVLALRGGLSDAFLARLDLFGVTAIAAFSPELVAVLDADARLTALGATSGLWRLYGLALPPPAMAVVPARGPVLTFAHFSVKPRAENGYDFIRLGEEAFTRAWLDAPMVLAHSTIEDESLDRFPAVLIVEARVKDPRRAAARLERYVQDGGSLVILEGDSALHAALRPMIGHARVRLVPRAALATTAQDPAEARAAASRDITRLFASLDELLPRGQAEPVEVRFDHGETALRLPRAPARPVPVLIKQSYFPDWREDRGAMVYLASPSFQLVFADRQELHLSRRSPGLTAIAWSGTALGLLGCMSHLRRRRRSSARPSSGGTSSGTW